MGQKVPVAGKCVLGGPEKFSVAGLRCGWLGGVLKDRGGRLGPLCVCGKDHGPWDPMAWFKFQPCHLLAISLWTNDSPLHVLVPLSIKVGITTVPSLGDWISRVNKCRGDRTVPGCPARGEV